MVWYPAGSSRSKLSTQVLITPLHQQQLEQLSKAGWSRAWSRFPVLSWDWWCICSCSQSASTFDALCLNLAPHLRFNEWLLELLFLSSQIKADWPFSSHLWHQHDIFSLRAAAHWKFFNVLGLLSLKTNRLRTSSVLQKSTWWLSPHWGM